jgi:hypothetical protein
MEWVFIRDESVMNFGVHQAYEILSTSVTLRKRSYMFATLDVTPSYCKNYTVSDLWDWVISAALTAVVSSVCNSEKLSQSPVTVPSTHSPHNVQRICIIQRDFLMS